MSIVTGEIDGVGYRKTARNAPMLLIEVETDRAGAWTLCEEGISGPYPRGGAKVQHKQQLAIYEDQWPEVQKLVRTDAHAAMLADAMASAPQTVREREQLSLGEQRRAAEAELAGAGTPRKQDAAASKLEDIEGAIAREALRLLCIKPGMRDGLPPLLSARVVRKAPPPPLPQNLAANAQGDLAAVLRQLLEERDGKRATKS